MWGWDMKHVFDFRNMEPWQKNRVIFIWGGILMVAAVFLWITVSTLHRDKAYEADAWQNALTEVWTDPAIVAERSVDAIPVTVGTYVENFREMSIKSGSFRIVFLAWFSWEGDEDLDMINNFRIYKGYTNKMTVVKDYHENGTNYQLVRCDVTVTKNFWTRRFPLESHQLKMYLESVYPLEKVRLVGDFENSGLNPNLEITGYDVVRSGNHIVNVEYDNNHGDPEISGNTYTSEFMTAIEINRSSWGLYVKCFIALLGTTTWVLITLFINTYHRVDPLGMLPAALFGTVSNIMVGANLLPDALEIGLLEFVNFWGIFIILIVALSVININRIRNKYEDKKFAQAFGRLMFFTTLALVLIGHALLPISAYLFV